MGVSALSVANQSGTVSHGALTKLTETVFSGVVVVGCPAGAGAVVPPVEPFGTGTTDPGIPGVGMAPGCWASAQPATPASPRAAVSTPGSQLWSFRTGSAPDRVPRRSRMDVPQNCEPSPQACRSDRLPADRLVAAARSPTGP